MTVEELVFYFEKFIGSSVDFYADLFWSNFSQKGGVWNEISFWNTEGSDFDCKQYYHFAGTKKQKPVYTKRFEIQKTSVSSAIAWTDHTNWRIFKK